MTVGPHSRPADQPAGRDLVEAEIAAEQDHVDKVYAQLAVDEEKARSLARASQEIYRSDRTSWVREEDGTAMFERDAFSFNAARRLAVLDSEHEGLVFGRLDLLEDGEVRHIGRLGVRDADYDPLVIDWRARAAEPFYRATTADPMGVVRRRVLRCRDDRVLGIEDDLLDAEHAGDLPVIGEGALMAALSRARDSRMHSIVATIQAEQDEAIRAPYSGVTTISGGPGTGKTVVALHRAAYLLYSHRARLENGGVLVIGPSSLFMSYIERVLPSLGEDSVSLRCLGQVASDVLHRGSDDPGEPRAGLLKGSLRMVELLRGLVATPLVTDPQALRLRVSVKGEVLTLTAPTLARTRRRILARQRHNEAGPAVEQSLVDQLWRLMPAETIAAHDLDRDEFTELVTSQGAYRMFLHAWWPPLDPDRVLARLSDTDLVARVAPWLGPEEREVLAASVPDADARGRRAWTVPDIALLDELAAVLGPLPPEPDADQPVFIEGGEASELVTIADVLDSPSAPRTGEDLHDTFAHVLVDEAQDLTPMQWRMVRRRGPQASWTIVGDPAQSSYPHLEETRQAMADLAPHSPSRTFRLSTNYRSPAEVFELASRVVVTVEPEADLPRAVRSTGVAPLLQRVPPRELAATVGARVAEMVEQVEGTVAVIAAPADLARFEGLVGPRVSVVTPLHAKGLEYDGVVVVDPERIVADSPGGVRVLYVALTRPTQRLAVVGRDDVDLTTAWQQALWGDRPGQSAASTSAAR